MSDIDNILNGAPAHQPGAPLPSNNSATQKSGIDEILKDAPPPDRGVKGWAQDLTAWGLKGAIAVPEAAVGFADLVSGGKVG